MKTCLTVVAMLIVVGGVSLAECADPLPATVNDPVTGMEFVLIKGGCYKMGDTFGDGEPNEKPAHEVCVSGFYLGKYEVTQAQWLKVREENPSEFKQCGPDCPVDSVSWNMAREYIKALNGKSGKQYRLPTEAEWEYAARSGGGEEKWAGTSDEGALGEFAWYGSNGGGKTHRVGMKKANGLGLYDMTGNVREWCQDWYGETYYAKSPKDNPAGPESGGLRVQRGGDWEREGKDVRAANRTGNEPDLQSALYGFRLVLPIP